MKRSYRFRLYPSRKQTALLESFLSDMCSLYNRALEVGAAAQAAGHAVPDLKAQVSLYADERKVRANLRRWSAGTAHRTLRRLDAAWRRHRLGRAGHPRCKPEDRFNSIEFVNREDARIDRAGRLVLQGIPGTLQVRWHRRMPAKSTLHAIILVRRGSQWYAVLQAEVPEPVIQGQVDKPEIGIDAGLINIVALSNGETVPAPRHLVAMMRKLRLHQRAMSRRVPGSRQWLEHRDALRRVHGRIVDARRDFLHRLSRDLVSRFSIIVIENLSPDRMRRTRLARSIDDAAWGELRRMIEYKA